MAGKSSVIQAAQKELSRDSRDYFVTEPRDPRWHQRWQDGVMQIPLGCTSPL